MRLDIKGHIVTIGTTAELSEVPKHLTYVNDKRSLQKFSLELNDQTGITGVKTTYIVLGGLNNGQPQNQDLPTPRSVVDAIDWAINFPDRIALLQLEKAK
jgi:NADP-dependent 3-hydroxy acid dehydrogenase YdfG